VRGDERKHSGYAYRALQSFVKEPRGGEIQVGKTPGEARRNGMKVRGERRCGSAGCGESNVSSVINKKLGG